MAEVDVFNLPVFSAADVFPMMADDELQELAADIKENGLREPIVIAEMHDKDGEVFDVLVDGRNRRAACKIAGVAPPIRRLNGEDPTAFVLSANIHRRHMNKWQRILAVAVIFPEPEERGRGKKGFILKHFPEASKDKLSQARVVVKWASDLVPLVMQGAMNFNDALKEAEFRREAKDNKEQALVGLRERYPDLADKVEAEELSLKAALVEADELDAKKRESLRTHLGVCKYALFNVGAFASDAHAQKAQESITVDDYLQEFNIDRKELVRQVKAFKQGVPRLIELLDSLMEKK